MLKRQLFKRPAQIIAAFVVIAVASILTTGAAVRGTQNFQLSCAGFESNGGRVILNRDNTGSGSESIALLATDGNGTVIYGPVLRTLPVGTSLEYPRGLFQDWTTSPKANPLFFTITSEAGNGFARETVYRSTGDCADLGGSGLSFINRRSADTLPAASIPDDLADANEAPDTPIEADDLADLLGLSGTGVVNARRLNIRSGDGIQYRQIGVLTNGAAVDIIGRNEAASWWYIDVDGERGWVSADFIILRGDLQYTDAAPAAAPLPRGEIIRPRFIFYQDYPIYAAPTTAAAELCQMPGNIEYNVLGRSPDWNWYQLQVTCNGAPLVGWAQSRLGALRQYGQEVPVIE